MPYNSEKTQVSVVIPCYNSNRTIKKCVESALSQEEVLLEVIVVDDGGSEKAADVLTDFLCDERLNIIRLEKNKGVANARNTGVKAANGEYIAFLDSDDWWDGRKLKKQLEIFENNGTNENIALVCTGREIYDSRGNATGKYIGVKEKITYEDLLKTNSINCSSVLIPKKTALEFPMGHDNMHEDYITWLSILKKYGTAYGIDEPLLKYRMDIKSKSGNKFKSAYMTYNVYKYLGLNFFQRIYHMMTYTINGIKKYR